MDVIVNGFDLTLDDVERVAQGRATAVLDEGARARIAASRQVV
jgi:histidine ammonia-lyase